MGDVFITDMAHFESIPPGTSHEPARRIARFFGAIVSTVSVSPADKLIEAALFCRRRPGMMQCPGHLQIRRDGVSGVISWHCSRCDDQGEISNWEGTSWNQKRCVKLSYSRFQKRGDGFSIGSPVSPGWYESTSHTLFGLENTVLLRY